MGTQMTQTKQITINEFYSIHRPHGHPALDAGPKNSNQIKRHFFYLILLILNDFLFSLRST